MARRNKEQILRDKQSKWTLFLKNGFSLFTACTKCGNIEYCRGTYRDTVQCRVCFGLKEEEIDNNLRSVSTSIT